MRLSVPIIVQYRHVHLSPQDRETLFGASLSLHGSLGHRDQFLAREQVDIIGKHGMIERVAVLGPERDETQVELGASEAFALGIDAPLRVSGDLGRTPGCRLRGPNGEVSLMRGVILPARHLHINETTARELGLAHLDLVELQIPGRSPMPHVVVRVHEAFSNELHISTDEAAEWWLPPNARAVLS